MGDVTDIADARKSATKPQKRKGGETAVTAEQLLSNDEVTELQALKRKLAEALARPDIHERDLKAVSVEYRAVRLELQEALARKEAAALGKRDGGASSGPRTFDGDI